jgi:hypothetical protein
MVSLPEGTDVSTDIKTAVHEVERIILRRLRERRAEGYTLEMAVEIVKLFEASTAIMRLGETRASS